MVSKFVQPDFTAQSATVYKTSIDDSVSVMARLAAQFACHEQSTPDMTVAIDAGAIYRVPALNEIAAQNTGTITAPSANPRVDRVVIDRTTGIVAVVTGAEDASPSAPAIGAGNAPIAKIALVVSQTSILNVDITDERDLRNVGNQWGEHQRQINDFTALEAHNGLLLEMDKATAYTLNLTAVATLREGWWIAVHNAGAGLLTIDPNGAETIDSAASVTLSQGESTFIMCDGDEFWTIGRSNGSTLTTEQASTSGTSIDFTGIPSWVKKIKIMLIGVSVDAGSRLFIQIGDAGGIEITGYTSVAGQRDGTPTYSSETAAFHLSDAGVAALVIHGTVELFLEDSANNTWMSQHDIARTDTTEMSAGAGSKSLSATLDRVRITTAGGTANFDAGAINILYE